MIDKEKTEEDMNVLAKKAFNLMPSDAHVAMTMMPIVMQLYRIGFEFGLWYLHKHPDMCASELLEFLYGIATRMQPHLKDSPTHITSIDLLTEYIERE